MSHVNVKVMAKEEGFTRETFAFEVFVIVHTIDKYQFRSSNPILHKMFCRLATTKV